MYLTDLDVDGLLATLVLQQEVVGSGILFVGLLDDQLSDVFVGSDHGPVGDVSAVLGPLAGWKRFALDGHRQTDNSTLSDHEAFLVFWIQLIVGIICRGNIVEQG